MNAPLSLWVEGIGAWAPGLVDWPAWHELLRGGDAPTDATPARPQPACLSAGERRRVSTHVLAAIEVADQAVSMSHRDAADLPCVFSSAHGDAGIMDYMCAVLADTPQHLSPTRFHNSVHNAPAGYWTIASQCRAPSTAVAALDAGFGAGLLEAATQAWAEDTPVLLVAHDEPGGGPLGEVLGTSQAFACALVLAPTAGNRSIARLDLALIDDDRPSDTPRHAHAARTAAANPSAHALPLLEALAGDVAEDIRLSAALSLGLAIHVQPAR